MLDVRDAPVHGLLAITKENAVRSEGKLLEDDAQGFEVEILVINTQDGESTRTLKAALGERRLNLRLDECLVTFSFVLTSCISCILFRFQRDGDWCRAQCRIR